MVVVALLSVVLVGFVILVTVILVVVCSFRETRIEPRRMDQINHANYTIVLDFCVW